MRRLVLLLMLLMLLIFRSALAFAQPAPPVVVLSQSGSLGPASADDLRRGLDQALKRGAQFVVIRRDTPGGLDPSMRSVIQAILASPVPVATFVAPDWRTRLLAVITDPGIAYILLMLGIYGLLFEFFSPGLVAPGVIGAICLLLALFALQLLPVNYAGLGLIALGVGLLVAEHFAPGFGLLGLGGITAFVIGSVMLIDTDAPAYRIPWILIAGMSAASVALLLLALNFALRARKQPIVSGREQMLGATAEVLMNSDGSLSARILGEVWQVRANAPLGRGQKVRVVDIDGLVLSVEPIGPQGVSP